MKHKDLHYVEMAISKPEQLNHLLGEGWHSVRLYDGDYQLISDKHIQFNKQEVSLSWLNDRELKQGVGEKPLLQCGHHFYLEVLRREKITEILHI